MNVPLALQTATIGLFLLLPAASLHRWLAVMFMLSVVSQLVLQVVQLFVRKEARFRNG